LGLDPTHLQLTRATHFPSLPPLLYPPHRITLAPLLLTHRVSHQRPPTQPATIPSSHSNYHHQQPSLAPHLGTSPSLATASPSPNHLATHPTTLASTAASTIFTVHHHCEAIVNTVESWSCLPAFAASPSCCHDCTLTQSPQRCTTLCTTHHFSMLENEAKIKRRG
ncbi:unnamed protein product, partial [Sphenostylis stenocarpa]